MTRLCVVCNHPSRKLIDRALLTNGTGSHRDLARRFGVSADSVDRHVKSKHIAAEVVAAVERAGRKVAAETERALIGEGEDLISKLQELITIAREVLTKAIEARQYGAAMAGVREVARIFELIARLTGQLDESARVNVAVIQRQARDEEQSLMLERLTVTERLELRRLVAKAQGEVETPAIGVALAANGIVTE